MGEVTKVDVRVKVKKLREDAILPVYATDGAACFDLHATEDKDIAPMRARAIPTGLSFEIPSGWAMLIYSRSGHAFKNGVRLGNCVGVIDSDYRGEVQVILHNDRDDCVFRVNPGDRIAQAMLIPVPCVALVEATDLSETDRGAGGFGSTGN